MCVRCGEHGTQTSIYHDVGGQYQTCSIIWPDLALIILDSCQDSGLELQERGSGFWGKHEAGLRARTSIHTSRPSAWPPLAHITSELPNVWETRHSPAAPRHLSPPTSTPSTLSSTRCSINPRHLVGAPFFSRRRGTLALSTSLHRPSCRSVLPTITTSPRITARRRSGPACSPRCTKSPTSPAKRDMAGRR